MVYKYLENYFLHIAKVYCLIISICWDIHGNKCKIRKFGFNASKRQAFPGDSIQITCSRGSRLYDAA